MWDPLNIDEVGKGVYWADGDMVMPRKATYQPQQASTIDPYTNWSANFMAPGVREGIPMPTKFAQQEHRTSLWDGPRSFVFNWDQMADFVTGPVAQRQGEYWWKVLANNEELDTPGFVNRGTWNAPPTGFTALRFITPASTRTSMTPL